MDKDTDRLAFQQKQLGAMGLEFERFRAAPFDELSAEQILVARKKWVWDFMPHDWLISSFYNHLALVQKVAAGTQPVLILEDDAEFADDFKQVLDGVEASDFQGDMIDLEASPHKQIVSKKTKDLCGSYNLGRLYLRKNAIAAYVLYPSGTKKLLRYVKKVFAPYDKLVDIPFHGLKISFVEPSPVWQEEEFLMAGSGYSNVATLKKDPRARSIRNKRNAYRFVYSFITIFHPFWEKRKIKKWSA